jgi:hypothetical protein
VGDCAFSGLVIDVRWLDGEALAEVVRLAEAGLMVILPRSPHPSGRRPRRDYGDLLEALGSCPNVVDRLGASGLRPLIAGADIPPYWARVTAEALYVFFAHPKAREVRYPMRYGQSLCRKRTIRRVTIDHDAGLFSGDLIFEPYQSLLLRVSAAEGVQFVDIGYRPPEPSCVE